MFVLKFRKRLKNCVRREESVPLYRQMVQPSLPQNEFDILSSLGEELRNVMITSSAEVKEVSVQRVISVSESKDKKCERCWQYVPSVGQNSKYPTLCCRCVGNLFGQPETRKFA